jgi:hypothetical protein
VGITRVDARAAHVAAQKFNESADILDATARNQLGRLQIDGATAGRQHTARGDCLRTELSGFSGELTQWSRSSTEIGLALVSDAMGYAAADERAAARLQ